MKTGKQLKREILNNLEANNLEFLDKVRRYAIRFAKQHGSVTADDVRIWADKHEIYPSHRNVWGAVFKGDQWMRIGFTKSVRPKSHATIISEWEYVGN